MSLGFPLWGEEGGNCWKIRAGAVSGVLCFGEIVVLGVGTVEPLPFSLLEEFSEPKHPQALLLEGEFTLGIKGMGFHLGLREEDLTWGKGKGISPGGKGRGFHLGVKGRGFYLGIKGKGSHLGVKGRGSHLGVKGREFHLG